MRQLQRQLARERSARLEAEAIAERGLRDLYESQRWLELLQRITDGANKARDVRSSLEMTVQEVCVHMGWDFGNAFLTCEETGQAVGCDCWFAAHPDMLFAFVEASRIARFSPGSGLPGRVLRDAQPHWIDDVRTDGNFLRRDVATDCALSSACAFPIFYGDQVVAILEFFSRKTLLEHDALVTVMAQIGIQLGRVVERERAQQALLYDALHDNLTGLGNRVLLAERSSAAFQRLPNDRNGLVALVIDLDGFKAVNDRYGHQVGDALLVEVASRLRSCAADFEVSASLGVRHETNIARVGGDEFVLLIEGAVSDEALSALATDVHRRIQSPYAIVSDGAGIGASIGIARSNATHEDFGQVHRDADLAMYAAKARGRGTTVSFTEDLGQAIRSRAQLERELREAIRHKQFTLHFQPIIDFRNECRVCGFEALVRWQHPDRGLLSPDEFMPAAEDSGLCIFIDDWVLEAACTAIGRLHGDNEAEDLPFVSINVTPKQFLQPHFVARVREVLMMSGVAASTVRLEVTEGVAIMDAVRTAQILDEIRAWGVRTSLDDFGTGYSSLSYLQQLPFDSLKIDRSFVTAMTDQRSRNIIKTIVDLARTMDMSVIAEGVETENQHIALMAMGCSMGQGYFYGRPSDATEAFAFIRVDSSLSTITPETVRQAL